MISSANNYAAVDFGLGTEMPFISFFPTCAATAWYHKKAAEAYLNMELEAFMEEARSFAANEYQAALFKDLTWITRCCPRRN